MPDGPAGGAAVPILDAEDGAQSPAASTSASGTNSPVTPLRCITLLLAVIFLAACGGSGGAVRDDGAAQRQDASAGNHPPVAVARADTEVFAGSTVTLDGTASADPDHDIQRYRWSQLGGPQVALASPDSATTTFEAPDVDRSTRLVFRLEVTDSHGARAEAQVTVQVRRARFRVTGTIRAASGSAVDGDVNDPAAPRVPNDTPETAQQIASPIVVGGYAAVAGAGPDGALRAGGDPSDFYRVQLRAGDFVWLAVAEPDAADLDLYLWNADGDHLIDASMDTGADETLQVPQSGTYLLEVVADRGASNYRLVIGDDPANGASSGLRLSADFVPGEIILERRPVASAKALNAGPMRAASAAPAPGGPELLRLPAGAGVLAQSASTAMRTRTRADVLERIDEVGRRQRLETLLAIKALRRDRSVAYAQPNFRVQPQLVPSDPHYPLQWHYPMIDLPSAWNLGAGANTTVAVLDSGVLTGHPDLAGQLVPGYDFVSSVDASGDGDGIDPDPTDPGPDEAGGSAPFHGTHVAGIVAAATGNRIGTAGVAFRSRIMPVRVLSAVGGSSYDILQGVRFAAGLDNDSGLRAPAVDVINLSLGRPGPCWPAEQAAFDAARAAGVIVVAAAGNHAIDAGGAFPASCRNVIAVGAVGPDRQPAAYSNYGSAVDVYAPGGRPGDEDGDGRSDGVLSLIGVVGPAGALQYGYAYRYGTSMASPHVAGVVAMMRSLNPALTPHDVDRLLLAGELTDADGVINARRAALAALHPVQGPTVEQPLEVAPASLDFGSVFNYAEVELSAACAADEVDVAVMAPWLQVARLPDRSGDAVRMAVSVDRGALSGGRHTDTVMLGCAGRYVGLPVTVQAAGTGLEADAGRLYVLLIDADSGTIAARAEASVVAGRYDFEFPDVRVGRYRLVAGTDVDNDGLICGLGESCGRYVDGEADEVLYVDGRENVIEFAAGPRVPLSGAVAGFDTLRR